MEKHTTEPLKQESYGTSSESLLGRQPRQALAKEIYLLIFILPVNENCLFDELTSW